MKYEIAVIGGGAAGLAAAISAAKNGAKVTIFEKNDSLGKKILATGNGKCNLSNLDMSKDKYYSQSLDRAWSFLEQFNTQDTVDFYAELGLITMSKNGYLYPYSEQASTVVEILNLAIKKYHITVKTGISVKNVQREHEKLKITAAKQDFLYDRVILACGGSAAPRTGSGGDGFYLAGKVGHHILPTVPALVQLTASDPYLRLANGVRAKVRISLTDERDNRVMEEGELQITDYGISGIVVFQISRLINYILLTRKQAKLTIDFMPDKEEKDFAKQMYAGRIHLMKNATVGEYFTGIWNRKLTDVFLKKSGIDPNTAIEKVSMSKILSVFEYSRSYTVTINGNKGFDSAQVTAGGVPLEEVTDKLESVFCKGLYLAGELLDVDGKCGGYNLQWAWCTGYLSGQNASEALA